MEAHNGKGGSQLAQLSLPVVCIEARTLPEGWEKAVLETWERGARVKTQYDSPNDPPSRDAIGIIAVADPMGEPRIHRAMPGGLRDLIVYVEEVVRGVHDHWIDPEHGKWQYTYHERLAAYSVPGLAAPLDQLDYIVDALAEAGYTRRAQAVTWKAWEDAGFEHPACLQRLWARVVDGKLCMNAHMRSNDAYKAAFMNMYAFTELQADLARRLSSKLGTPIGVGQYTHIADSFHIYGSYFADFEGFLKTVEQRSFEQRTFVTETVQEILDEARAEVEREQEAQGA
jgi:thymidylate synthase